MTQNTRKCIKCAVAALWMTVVPVSAYVLGEKRANKQYEETETARKHKEAATALHNALQAQYATDMNGIKQTGRQFDAPDEKVSQLPPEIAHYFKNSQEMDVLWDHFVKRKLQGYEGAAIDVMVHRLWQNRSETGDELPRFSKITDDYTLRAIRQSNPNLPYTDLYSYQWGESPYTLVYSLGNQQVYFVWSGFFHNTPYYNKIVAAQQTPIQFR